MIKQRQRRALHQSMSRTRLRRCLSSSPKRT